MELRTFWRFEKIITMACYLHQLTIFLPGRGVEWDRQLRILETRLPLLSAQLFGEFIIQHNSSKRVQSRNDFCLCTFLFSPFPIL